MEVRNSHRECAEPQAEQANSKQKVLTGNVKSHSNKRESETRISVIHFEIFKPTEIV